MLSQRIYDLTDKGRENYIKGKGFCYGTPTLIEIINFSEQQLLFGNMVSEVVYEYRLKGIPKWAVELSNINPGNGLFAEIKKHINSSKIPIRMRDMFILTNEGWMHVNQFKDDEYRGIRSGISSNISVQDREVGEADMSYKERKKMIPAVVLDNPELSVQDPIYFQTNQLILDILVNYNKKNYGMIYDQFSSEHKLRKKIHKSEFISMMNRKDRRIYPEFSEGVIPYLGVIAKAIHGDKADCSVSVRSLLSRNSRAIRLYTVLGRKGDGLGFIREHNSWKIIKVARLGQCAQAEYRSKRRESDRTPRNGERSDAVRIMKAKQDIRVLDGALNLYKLDNQFYPSTEQGLEALVQKPLGKPKPRNWKLGGYIDRLPVDPWGNSYQYLNPGAHGAIDIYSLGADGRPGGEGIAADIGSWNLE